WCVEGVWQGELIVTPYALLEQRGERHRFAAQDTLYGHRGSAGSLIPPHEYHTIRNTSADAAAVSLHIYQAEMACCSKYGHRDGEWYARETTELATDKAA
ncbi:MAG: cysteine dioxygenase, partial [Thermomonas sp.]